MSEIDYAELFKSPLGEPDQSGNRWGPLAAGLVVGVLVMGALAVFGGAEPSPAEPTAAATTIPTTGVPAAQEYPPGFAEFAPGIAAQPFELIRSQESLLVAFHTAVQRGSNPADAAWPIGGTWWLENADGTGVESNRVIIGRFTPSLFSVEFPRSSGSDADARIIRMIERWDLETEIGSEQVPFDGEPFEIAASLSIPINSEVTLVIDELQLGRFLGGVSWRLDGSEEPVGRVLIEVGLLDATGAEVGTYGAFPEILEPAGNGVTEIFWQEPFPQDQEGSVTAEVRYSVGLVDVVAATTEFDLQGVPAGR